MAIQDYYKPLTIQRNTLTDNGMGGQSESWATHLSIEGLINQQSSQQIYIANKLDVKVSHKLYCDANLDIKTTDRVLYDSKLYRIVGEPKNAVNMDHHFTIDLLYIGGVD